MKRRAWKWALGLVAVLALAIGGLLWSAHSRATAVFQRHDALVKDAIAELRARPIVRAPLSEPRPGDGRPAIAAVLGEFEAIADGSLVGLPSFVDEKLPPSLRHAIRCAAVIVGTKQAVSTAFIALPQRRISVTFGVWHPLHLPFVPPKRSSTSRASARSSAVVADSDDPTGSSSSEAEQPHAEAIAKRGRTSTRSRCRLDM